MGVVVEPAAQLSLAAAPREHRLDVVGVAVLHPRAARLVAGLGLVDGNSWFVKMTGEAAPVAAARPDFLEIVRSLRREASN